MPEVSNSEFVQAHTSDDYRRAQAVRERVRDVTAGAAVVKSLGGNLADSYKYLIPTERQKSNADEYQRYLAMAVWPGYTGATDLTAGGLLAVGEPTWKIPPNHRELQQLIEYATPFKDGVKALQLRINRRQRIDGQCVLLMEVNSDERIRNGDPMFFINSYKSEKFLTAWFDFEDGESIARFVILDESDYEFDWIKKRRNYVNKYRLLGIDERDRYYQMAFRADQWNSIDIRNPRPAADPANPQFGEAFYPAPNGRVFNRIPLTWCNVTNLSGASYENPMLADLADLDLSIFNADAAYRQTLWLTSQPINVITGGNGDKILLAYGAGAVHYLPDGYKEEWLEFTGAGAGAQRTALEDLHARAIAKSMSLFGNVGSNQSGEALKIIQGAQVAPLVSMVQTSGDAITEQLRYAARWLGMSREQAAEEVLYSPSENFARLNLSITEIMNVVNGMANNADLVPLLEKEVRRAFVESGLAEDMSWDEFLKAWQEEKEERQASRMLDSAELG